MNTIKKATTKFPVAEVLKNRWSARSFSGQEISEEELHTLLEAGSWAFSANNEQPWRIIAGRRGTENFESILSALLPGNSPWAKHAAALVLSIAKTDFDKEGNPYNSYAEHDLGAFNFALSVQATTMGLTAHPMAGFDKQKANDSFALAPNMKPMVVLAVGHVDHPEKLEEPYKTRELTPRSRKGLEEIMLK